MVDNEKVVGKDWSGSKDSVFIQRGSSQIATNNRDSLDYYATEPKALELLLDSGVRFSENVWEPACGEGHLSKVLEKRGYDVLSTDLVDRGYGVGNVNFLTLDIKRGSYDGDVVTNPPYKFALEFAQKALDVVSDGHMVAMFLKIQFLEGVARRKFFEENPPAFIYVSSRVLHCALNGDFEHYGKSNAATYCWILWRKGLKDEPRVRWFN